MVPRDRTLRRGQTPVLVDRTREGLVNDVVLPLLGIEVRMLSRRGKKVLFNFAAISHLTIVKSESKLIRRAKGALPPELEDDDFIESNDATAEFMDALKIGSLPRPPSAGAAGRLPESTPAPVSTAAAPPRTTRAAPPEYVSCRWS